MSSASDAVSVIVPTLASTERAPSLTRAIGSALSQHGASVPIVVVNGRLASADVIDSLSRRRDVRLVTLPEAGLPAALRRGRAAVDTPYFCVLDDDDELLPGALATRLRAFDEDPAADVVVTSGYLEGFGRRQLNFKDFREVERDPPRALFRRNWLRPCAGLFRAGTVTLDYFEHIPAYREWTYLGLRLGLERKIRFVDSPTFVYRTDTPASLSKSKAYCLAEPSAIAQMLRLNLPRDLRPTVRAHLRAGLHSASDRERLDGNYRAAWVWHLKCLVQAGGWRYLSYTRHLIAGSMRRMGAALGPLGYPLS